MPEVRIAAIVEGHGEVEAVPELIRRIGREIDPGFVPVVRPVLRTPGNKLLREKGLEHAVEYAACKLGGRGGILVLTDCDWENACPARDGPMLARRAAAARGDLPIAVVLARHEFEAWFLAAAESLRGLRGLPADLAAPERPESIRGAKEWLTERMPPQDSYSETTDQAALTAKFDMETARRRSDSFDKCYREVRKLLERVRAL